jgi:hypothetical protein
VPQDISTEDDFIAYLHRLFPLFSNDTIAEVLLAYPSPNQTDNPTAPEYATNGISGASAVNVSQFGAGQQQRADNLYAETTFVCPSYWLAQAFATAGLPAYKVKVFLQSILRD